MKSRKTNKILICALALLCTISCNQDDLLNQLNPNEIPLEGFFRDAADAKVSVNGMYHSITNVLNFGRILHIGSFQRSDEFNVLPERNVSAAASFLGEPGTGRWSVEPYQEGYKAIFRANTILENVNEENVPDQTERNNILGQAYFIRAFSYWTLVNHYGNIPLLTKTPDPTNNEELFPAQAPPSEVWDQIIADFEQAEVLLPDSWPESDLARATKWADAHYHGNGKALYRPHDLHHKQQGAIAVHADGGRVQQRGLYKVPCPDDKVQQEEGLFHNGQPPLPQDEKAQRMAGRP